MEKTMTIGEVARLLDIPESTLRFWQEKRIFDVPQDGNSYRKYTVTDLINIAEIAFYRNIGMPVKEMEHFNNFNLRDYDKILGNVKAALEEKILMYQAMHDLVQLKSGHIRSIEELKGVDYLYGKVPFTAIARFEYSDKDKLIRYTQNPSLYVRFMDSQNLKRDIRGIIAEPAKESASFPLLWKKTDDRPYAVFLIEEIASENYINNIPEKLSVIQKKHKTGVLLANFLLSETADGKRIDYLKGYVQILE